MTTSPTAALSVPRSPGPSLPLREQLTLTLDRHGRRVAPVGVGAEALVITGSRCIQVPDPRRDTILAPVRRFSRDGQAAVICGWGDLVAIYPPIGRRRRWLLIAAGAAFLIGAERGFWLGRITASTVAESPAEGRSQT